MNPWSRTIAVVLAAALLTRGGGADAERFSFAALGDTPYFDFEVPRLMAAIGQMNRRALEFVVHVGDIKSGSDRCDLDMYETRADWFGQIRHPVLVLPGDNDWTDCARASNGGYDPAERLGVFRRVFHAGEFDARLASLGVVRQSGTEAHAEYAENVRWLRGGVLFVAVHVVGSRNNVADPEEHRRRQQANDAWLRESFAQARDKGARAAVVMLHANLMLEMAAGDPRRKGFAAFTETLGDEVAAFDRPVLLIHGDTHHHRFEQPLRARALPGTLRNLTRLEVHGSPTVAWTEVQVDTETAQVFSAREGR